MPTKRDEDEGLTRTEAPAEVVAEKPFRDGATETEAPAEVVAEKPFHVGMSGIPVDLTGGSQIPHATRQVLEMAARNLAREAQQRGRR